MTRPRLGHAAAALLLFLACSEASTPAQDWDTGADRDTPRAGARNGGGASAVAGAPDEPVSGATSSGGASAAAGSSGKSNGGTGTTGGKSGGSTAGRGGSPGSAGELGSSGETGSAGDGPADDFFGDSRCSNELDFCDGFEGGALASEYATQGAVPTLDSTRAARGSKSAHFTTTGNGLSILRYDFAAPRTAYYGRLFVWFEALPTAPKWAHWTIVGATGEGTEAEIRVGGQFDGSTNRFGAGTDHGETGDWTLLSEEQDAIPEGQWLCVEWFHDGEADESRFWSDEVEHASLRATATRHGGEGTYDLPEFTQVFVGWWHYQMDPTPNRFNVWIDELAIDDERIGCTR